MTFTEVWSAYLWPLIIIVAQSLLLMVTLLIIIAYLLLADRKIWAAVPDSSTGTTAAPSARR